MQEFLLKNYNLITSLVEGMAALTGLLLFKKYEATIYKYFIFFLVYLTICDFVTGYTRLVYPGRLLSFLVGTIIEESKWFSTLYWKIGAIMFYAFYYRKILKTKLFKIIIKYSSYSFFIFSIIFIIFNFKAFFNSYFPIISVLGALIIFLCTIFYFLEILQNEKILTFHKSLNFYIAASIFIWWLIITPIVFYDNYAAFEILVYERDLDFIRMKMLIYLASNIIMYSTFTFALIWCRPQKK